LMDTRMRPYIEGMEKELKEWREEWERQWSNGERNYKWNSDKI
jgi:hypothetical protein